jgi:hypothetical protein
MGKLAEENRNEARWREKQVVYMYDG